MRWKVANDRWGDAVEFDIVDAIEQAFGVRLAVRPPVVPGVADRVERR